MEKILSMNYWRYACCILEWQELRSSQLCRAIQHNRYVHAACTKGSKSQVHCHSSENTICTFCPVHLILPPFPVHCLLSTESYTWPTLNRDDSCGPTDHMTVCRPFIHLNSLPWRTTRLKRSHCFDMDTLNSGVKAISEWQHDNEAIRLKKMHYMTSLHWIKNKRLKV